VAWRRTDKGMRRRRSRRAYQRLEAEATAWRGSARAAVAAANPGKTSALRREAPRTAKHPGDDGTGTANATPAPGQSQEHASVDDKVQSSPETTNHRRRFASRSGQVAIWKRWKDSMKSCGWIDRSSRSLSGGVGGEAGAAGLGRSVAATLSPHDH
jgi:hypothetical protein